MHIIDIETYQYTSSTQEGNYFFDYRGIEYKLTCQKTVE